MKQKNEDLRTKVELVARMGEPKPRVGARYDYVKPLKSRRPPAQGTKK